MNALPTYSYTQAEKDSLLKQLSRQKTNDTLILKTLFEISKTYYHSSQTDSALFYTKQGLNLSEKLNRKADIALFHNASGQYYIQKGDYISALKHHLIALQLREELNTKKEIASSLNNIGLVYQNIGNDEKALTFFSKALELNKQIQDKEGIAHNLGNLSILYAKKKKYDAAILYGKNALELWKELNSPRFVAANLNNLGNYYLEKKELDTAITHYRKALEINTQINDSNGIASRLQNIGIIYQKNQQYDSAHFYFTNSLKISKSINNKAIMSSNHLSLSDLYAQKGLYKNAYEHHLLFYTFSDSLLNDKITEQMSEMQTKYETEKKELQIKNLEQEQVLKNTQLNRQKIINYFIAGGLLLVIVTSVFIFRNYHEKKKLSKSLSEKNKEITDSINYAKRIQEAILPAEELFRQYFNENFIIYLPKDIVSGDFYWFSEKENKLIFSAIDCTGHGVPGAFMSFIGYSILNQIVKENGVTKPSEILNELSKGVYKNLQQQNINSGVKDAMDISLCCYDKKNNTLEYSGAYNPLYYFRNNQYYDIRADKIAIGNYSEHTKYTNHKIELQKNDTLYIFSDGYPDQFGGEKEKKFSYKQFREILLSINTKPMQEQKNILTETFLKWKGSYGQTDDVLIIGIRI